jgi:hypothetical protein
MSVSSELLPHLTAEAAATLSEATARDVFCMGAENLRPEALICLAERYPAVALLHGAAALTEPLLARCAAAVPGVAIVTKHAHYLSDAQVAAAVEANPRCLLHLPAERVAGIPTDVLVRLLAAAPEVVLSVTAAAEGVPKDALRDLALDGLLTRQEAEGASFALWSTVWVHPNAGLEHYRLFTYGIGQWPPGKNQTAQYEDTNLLVGASISYHFTTRAVRYALLGTDADVRQVAEAATLRWEYGATMLVDIAPLLHFSRRGSDLRSGTFHYPRDPSKTFGKNPIGFICAHHSFAIQCLLPSLPLSSPVGIRVALLGDFQWP